MVVSELLVNPIGFTKSLATVIIRTFSITLTNSNQIHFEKQSQGLIPLPHQTSFYNQNGFMRLYTKNRFNSTNFYQIEFM